MSHPDLFDELELEARARAVGLEALGKLPANFAKKHYPMTLREQAESRRLRAAMEAAPDADTFVALAKGDIVPEHRLNKGLIAYHDRRVQHRRPEPGGGV